MYSFFSPATVFLVTEIIPGLHDTSIYNTRGKSSLFSCDTYSSTGQKYVTLACGKISIYLDENSMCGLHRSKNIYSILPEAVAGKKKKKY
jgi:hypothetical protein